LESPDIKAAAKSIEQGFEKRPYFIAQGGSIHIVTMLKKSLGVDTLLLGWGQDDDKMHSPNDKVLNPGLSTWCFD